VCGEEAALSELAFRAKASNGYDEAFMEACRAELTYDAGDLARFTVADLDGDVAGVVGLVVGDHSAELTELWVDPSVQAKGVGRALVEWARDSTPLAFPISVEADPEAVQFYQALGFHLSGTAPSGSIPGRELPVMTLDAGGRGLAG
jgi:GNAT superfamily N-acetyltransferase